jgi:hypothetical protein
MKNISHIKNIKDSGQFQISSDPRCIDLEQYLCPDRICEQCGNDHDFNPSFDGVKTSMDILPELLTRRRERSIHTNLIGNKKKTRPIGGVHVRAISKTWCGI